MLSHVRLSATLRAVDHWALCPWHFTGKKYWSGLPFPTPGYLPNSGIKPSSQELVDWFFHWATDRHINNWDEIRTFPKEKRQVVLWCLTFFCNEEKQVSLKFLQMWRWIYWNDSCFNIKMNIWCLFRITSIGFLLACFWVR